MTALDAVFARLKLWQDANSDGVSQTSELLLLSDAGITSIGLEIRELTKLDFSVAQNQVLGRTEVGRADGTTTSAFDVALYFKSRNEPWRPDEDCGCHVPTEPQPILIAESVL